MPHRRHSADQSEAIALPFWRSSRGDGIENEMFSTLFALSAEKHCRNQPRSALATSYALQTVRGFEFYQHREYRRLNSPRVAVRGDEHWRPPLHQRPAAGTPGLHARRRSIEAGSFSPISRKVRASRTRFDAPAARLGSFSRRSWGWVFPVGRLRGSIQLRQFYAPRGSVAMELLVLDVEALAGGPRPGVAAMCSRPLPEAGAVGGRTRDALTHLSDFHA